MIHGKEEDILSRSKELLGKWGADIVFETAGNQVTASQTTKLVARGGKILIVMLPMIHSELRVWLL